MEAPAAPNHGTENRGLAPLEGQGGWLVAVAPSGDEDRCSRAGLQQLSLRGVQVGVSHDRQHVGREERLRRRRRGPTGSRLGREAFPLVKRCRYDAGNLLHGPDFPIIIWTNVLLPGVVSVRRGT